MLPVLASAATYYVDKDSIGGTCNNNNAGTNIAAPWCTIAKATATVISGDTVYIRAGIYTENDGSAVLRTHSSGTAGNYITFQNYNNEAVIMRNQPIGIYNNQNYIRFIGLRVENENRDTSIMEQGIRLDAGNHVIVQYCTVYNLKKQHYSRGIQLGEQASYYQILNNTVMYVGQRQSEGEDDLGECVWIGGTYNLVQGNTLRYGGHNTALIGGNYNILRRNTMDNTNWNRVMQTANPYENYRQLVEDNIIRNSGEITEWLVPNSDVQLQASNTIFRRNRIYNSLGSSINMFASGDYTTSNVHFFHNVVYNGGTAHIAPYGYAFWIHETDPEVFENLIIKNNIFYLHYLHDAEHDPVHQRTDIRNPNPNWDDVFCTANHYRDDVDPRFTNPGSGDFTLQSSSPCINAGTWLTVTRSAGSGTSIPVNDASYFTDGWNIIEGDIIQLQGQTTTARITSINYDTNTITVDRSLTWTSGQGVALAYSGSAPDIGVYEYAGGTPPPQCTGTCKTNTCSSYTSCSIASGTCSSGYCCTGTCTTTPPPPPVNPATISYWSFDDSANPGRDYVGSNNGILQNSPTWTSSGHNNGAISFDGTNDYIDCGKDSSLSPENFTVTAWINLRALSTENLVARKAENPYKGWAFFIQGATQPKLSFDFFYGDGTSATHQNLAGNTNLQTNNWYHVAITVINGNSVRFYLNGALDGERTLTQRFTYPDRSLMIGKSESGYFGGYTNGIIDEVRIYNYVLSANEILTQYNNSTGTENKADLNNDGKTDVADLSIVASDFGKTSNFNNAKSDTNNDGIVDIYDVVYVASRIS